MNAIAPGNAPAQQETEPTARRLAMLQRLAEFGMRLAEQAAEEALAEPPPSAEPVPKRRCGPDPRYVFLRLSRFVRDIIALEIRIEAGQLPAPPRKTARTGADPRADAVHTLMTEIIETSPHAPSIKAGFQNQLNDLIAQSIAADPDRHHPAASIVADICEELGLATGRANLPDHPPAPPPHFVDEMARVAAASKAVEAALAAHRARARARARTPNVLA